MSVVTLRKDNQVITMSIEKMPNRKRHGLYIHKPMEDGTMNLEPLAYFTSERSAEIYEIWLCLLCGSEEDE